MQVRREDGDQRGDAPGASRPAGRRVHRQQAARDLGNATGVDDLAVARDVRRHDPLVPARLDEMHETREDEERAEESPHTEILWPEDRLAFADGETLLVERPADDHPAEVVQTELVQRAKIVESADAARVDQLAFSGLRRLAE